MLLIQRAAARVEWCTSRGVYREAFTKALPDRFARIYQAGRLDILHAISDPVKSVCLQKCLCKIIHIGPYMTELLVR